MRQPFRGCELPPLQKNSRLVVVDGEGRLHRPVARQPRISRRPAFVLVLSCRGLLHRKALKPRVASWYREFAASPEASTAQLTMVGKVSSLRDVESSKTLRVGLQDGSRSGVER